MCMRRPGCFPGAGGSRHLQVVTLHLKIIDLSASFIDSNYVLSFPVSEQARGGRRPRSEAPRAYFTCAQGIVYCIYIMLSH